MLNSVDTLVLTCLNVVDISYCSSFLPETLPHLTCVFPWPLCFPTTSQAVPSHPSQQPSFLHWPLSCWYPPRLFLGALLSSFCVTLLGGFSFTCDLSYHKYLITPESLSPDWGPTCCPPAYRIYMLLSSPSCLNRALTSPWNLCDHCLPQEWTPPPSQEPMPSPYLLVSIFLPSSPCQSFRKVCSLCVSAITALVQPLVDSYLDHGNSPQIDFLASWLSFPVGTCFHWHQSDRYKITLDFAMLLLKSLWLLTPQSFQFEVQISELHAYQFFHDRALA